MTEEVFPIDLKGVDSFIVKNAVQNTGIVAWLASFPGAVWSIVWTIMWIVQDGHGLANSPAQANWNADPHLFMLMAFVVVAQLVLPYFYRRVNKLILRDGGNSEKVTKIYNQLTPINKQLARPVVEKVYELERSGVWNTEVSRAYDARIGVMKKIKSEQEKEFHNSLVIDNSDLDAVEYVLKQKKEIANV